MYDTCEIHGVRKRSHPGGGYTCDRCDHESHVEDLATFQLSELQQLRRAVSEQRGSDAFDWECCHACGQTFVAKTRVSLPIDQLWTGILERYSEVGVCPRCYNTLGWGKELERCRTASEWIDVVNEAVAGTTDSAGLKSLLDQIPDDARPWCTAPLTAFSSRQRVPHEVQP